MLPAIGIGALIGGLTAKQRGGNFLKGALTGAALGGVGGMLGSKAAGHGWFGAGKGGAGIFGLGKGWAGVGLPLAGITAGTEMLGQQEANLQQKLAQQRWLDEEEDRRVSRLNEYAGYDVTDPKNFLTPQKFFMAGGGLASLPHYANGGWHDVPMEEGGPTMDPEIMRLPMGQEGSFEEENEGMVGLELAGLTDEEMSELQALQSLSIVTPEGDPNYEKIQIRLQELMGRMKVAKGGHINRPGYFLGGATKGLAQLFASGKAGDAAGDIEEWYDQELIEDEEDFDSRSLMLGPPRGEDTEDTGASGDSNKKLGMILNALRAITPMAQGGQVNRPGYFLGGLAALLGAGVLGSKIFGKKEATKAPPKPMIEKMPGPIAMLPDDEEENQIGLHPVLLNRAQGGIADLDMRGGGHSIGPGTGTSDDVPAMLSDGEFVMTANAVSNLGGGDRMVGAQRMYNMMNSLDPNSQTPGEMNVAGYG